VPEYLVTFARSARKELESLSNPLVQRIFTKIEALGDGPRPSGCKKLRGSEDLWRIRIGDYRVIYSIDDGEKYVDIVAIRHRSLAYD
jgi:mRNA interferase RelE/StbE